MASFSFTAKGWVYVPQLGRTMSLFLTLLGSAVPLSLSVALPSDKADSQIGVQPLHAYIMRRTRHDPPLTDGIISPLTATI